MTILFKTPVRPNAASRIGTIHVAILAFYSRVIERLVKANLQYTPKRIVSAIYFNDETVEPRDVALLVDGRVVLYWKSGIARKDVHAVRYC